MCRWAAYIGPEIFLEEIIIRPCHSLIYQSQHACESKTAVNGDGFGVAWYGDRPDPGLFRDTSPAWSDPNLTNLALHVKSPLFLAHVRASTGSATSRNNCHPFVQGNWSYMHNGQIGGYDLLRKQIDQMIPDALYPQRKGATDSEALLLVALGEGLADDPKGAMERTVNRMERLSRERGISPHMRCTAAFSDGQTLYAMRYASDKYAPSLYYRKSVRLGGYAVVSEPLEVDQDDWICVPAGGFLEITEGHVAVSEFQPDRA